MISTRILSKTLQELHALCRTDFTLAGKSGQILAQTSPDLVMDPPAVCDFLNSSADSMSVSDILIYKISDRDKPEYALLSRGEQADLFGRIAVSAIRNILEASGERSDQNHFIQNVLLDNFLPIDMKNEARRLKIREDAVRVVFLIETAEDDNEPALQTLRAIYTSPRGTDFITPLDTLHLAVVREFPSGNLQALEMKTANTLSDMLNTEAMISVRIACGTPVSSLSGLSQSCREAQLALEVGRIFYPDRRIICYDNLGIGRLIYQLPTSLCELFLKETFSENIFEVLTEEDLTTIRHFFNNNLNISETSRQLYIHRNTLVYRLERLEKLTGLDIRRFEDAMTFKIAMMVDEYLRSMKHPD